MRLRTRRLDEQLLNILTATNLPVVNEKGKIERRGIL